MPVATVILAPQLHFNSPVNSVGELVIRGGVLAGVRASRLILTRSKVAASMMAGTLAFIHSTGGRLVLALESRMLVKYSPM
ncbi:MAG: hypothetical protein ABIS30_00715 [Gallionella sp.]